MALMPVIGDLLSFEVATLTEKLTEIAMPVILVLLCYGILQKPCTQTKKSIASLC